MGTCLPRIKKARFKEIKLSLRLQDKVVASDPGEIISAADCASTIAGDEGAPRRNAQNYNSFNRGPMLQLVTFATRAVILNHACSVLSRRQCVRDARMDRSRGRSTRSLFIAGITAMHAMF